MLCAIYQEMKIKLILVNCTHQKRNESIVVDVDTKLPLFTAGGNVNWSSYLGKQYRYSLEKLGTEFT